MELVFAILGAIAEVQRACFFTLGHLLKGIRYCYVLIWSFAHVAGLYYSQLKILLFPKPTARCGKCSALLQYCNASFHREPLPDAESDFRLIRLLLEEEALSCEMQAFPLRSAPMYTALSYRWTEDEPSDAISINGEGYFIRDNLYTFLRTAKAEGNAGWLFIDAMCINQHDFDERSSQVALMRDVYKHALKVTIWLGLPAFLLPRDGESRDIVRQARACRQTSYFLADGMLQRFSYNIGHDEADFDHDAFLIWIVACMNEYWTRLWPIQEMLVADQLELKAEWASIDWNRFAAIYERVHRPDPVESGTTMERHRHKPPHLRIEKPSDGKTGSVEEYPASHIMTMMRQILLRRRDMASAGTSSERMPLFEAVLTFAAQRCSNPRDKIFGLLGISTSRMRADYHMPLADVYMHALHEGMAEIVNGAGSDKRQNSTKQMDTDLKLYCHALQYALGISSLNPTVMMMATEAVITVVPPTWYFDDLSWIDISALRNTLESLLQSETTMLAGACIIMYQAQFYIFVIRLSLGRSFNWMYPRPPPESWGAWVLAKLADIVNLTVWLVLFLHVQAMEVAEGAMAFPSLEEDVRTRTEWNKLNIELWKARRDPVEEAQRLERSLADLTQDLHDDAQS